MKKHFSYARMFTVVALSLVVAGLTGCAMLDGRIQNHQANNLFKFLYSDETSHVDTPDVPVLSLPLRVGIAFVPVDRDKDRRYFSWNDDATFTEAQKMELMKQIGEQFKSYPFVKSIEFIPTTYLRPRGGFTNLDQLRTMHGIDVMALLSYDQVQFTDEGLLSLSYWTIVGAYVVQGEKNDTQTMLDAAVYDIASRQLLFRSPGTSQVRGRATPINLNEQLRADSERGYKEAATNLVTNLKVQLASFQERVKSSPTEYKVVHKPGYTGAGAVGGIELGFIMSLAAAFLWTRRTTRA